MIAIMMMNTKGRSSHCGSAKHSDHCSAVNVLILAPLGRPPAAPRSSSGTRTPRSRSGACSRSARCRARRRPSPAPFRCRPRRCRPRRCPLARASLSGGGATQPRVPQPPNEPPPDRPCQNMQTLSVGTLSRSNGSQPGARGIEITIGSDAGRLETGTRIHPFQGSFSSPLLSSPLPSSPEPPSPELISPELASAAGSSDSGSAGVANRNDTSCDGVTPAIRAGRRVRRIHYRTELRALRQIEPRDGVKGAGASASFSEEVDDRVRQLDGRGAAAVGRGFDRQRGERGRRPFRDREVEVRRGNSDRGTVEDGVEQEAELDHGGDAGAVVLALLARARAGRGGCRQARVGASGAAPPPPPPP